MSIEQVDRSYRCGDCLHVACSQTVCRHRQRNLYVCQIFRAYTSLISLWGVWLMIEFTIHKPYVQSNYSHVLQVTLIVVMVCDVLIPLWHFWCHMCRAYMATYPLVHSVQAVSFHGSYVLSSVISQLVHSFSQLCFFPDVFVSSVNDKSYILFWWHSSFFSLFL